MKIEITSATVLRGDGADETAERWMEKNLPEVKYKVIQMR